MGVEREIKKKRKKELYCVFISQTLTEIQRLMFSDSKRYKE